MSRESLSVAALSRPGRREVNEDAYDLRGSCGFSFGNGCSGGTTETNLFGTPKRAKTPMEVA